ncbi:hypothetical protein HK099_003320, partial [Clydaea vesicula]
ISINQPRKNRQKDPALVPEINPVVESTVEQVLQIFTVPSETSITDLNNAITEILPTNTTSTSTHSTDSPTYHNRK